MGLLTQWQFSKIFSTIGSHFRKVLFHHYSNRSSNRFLEASETNMLVATLIATVSFTAAFTVPGGYNQNGSVQEGLAVVRKTSAFRVFLIANTLAFTFTLSTTSVYLHFLASATDEDVAFHKKVARRTAFLTNWSSGTLLVAFIAGTYSMVPHSLGITVAVLLCCCFLSSLFFPLSIKRKDELIDS
ncbi:ankyrin repeat-containing protein itn1 [Quercus suber]|uniref:Ankyrin repeat-containing protein itn1 n=1 Tax=Quercus suber TaxID=58331 RepID=A0AAW0L757_QUESU